MCAIALTGQSAPRPDPLAIIRAETRPIAWDRGDGFSGQAWDDLVADAQGAQFVMVGEQHGSGDIARLETAFHRTLAERGFTHSALEVGPISTKFAEQLIRSGAGKLQDFIAAPGNGFTLPFLFFAEEAQMAEAMVRTSPDAKQALFGLDQEFVGAAPILIRVLENAARTPAQRTALQTFRAASAKDKMLIGKIEERGLEPLQRAYSGNKAAMEIIDAIRTSAGIYKPFITGTGSAYAGNLARETYIKGNFVRQFEEARRRNGKAPKVFLKFGGYHAMRGMSGTNVPALGNFLAEWGLPQGYRMVNLMVDCIGGETMNPQTNAPAPCESYFPKEGLLHRAVVDGGPVQIVDLRALRPQLGRLKDADEQTRKVILAFDYYVAVKDGRAATLLGTPAS